MFLTIFLTGFAFLATGCLTMEGSSAERTDIFINADNPAVSYTGRFDFPEEGLARFAHSSSRIVFRFEGTRCEVLLSDNPYYSLASDYLQVIVDGMSSVPLKVVSWKNRYLLADNLWNSAVLS